MEIRQLQRYIHEWANDTFPRREFKTTLAKLMVEEIPEFFKNPDDPGEFADLVILIFDLASMKGIDVENAVRDKMITNESRSWVEDETGLFYRHKD